MTNQKCIITIEGDDKADDGETINVKFLWKPKLDLRDNSKNNTGVVKVALTMMNAFSKMGKTLNVKTE